MPATSRRYRDRILAQNRIGPISPIGPVLSRWLNDEKERGLLQLANKRSIAGPIRSSRLRLYPARDGEIVLHLVDQQVPCVTQPTLMLTFPGVVDIQHFYLFRSRVIDAGYQYLVVRLKRKAEGMMVTDMSVAGTFRARCASFPSHAVNRATA